MANVQIPGLTALAGAIASGDLLEIADVSAANASRKVTVLGLHNGLTLTATTSGVLTIANSKTLTASNTLTLAGTDGTTMTFPSTNATLARTDAANTFTGVQTMTSPSLTTSVVTASTTFALFNATATTVNAFGAATALNIGASAAMVLNFGGFTSAAEFRFLEPSGSGTNYSGFKQPSLATSITYTLPSDAPVNGDVLTVQADGTMSWEAPSGSANAVTLASAAASSGLLIVSAGADRTATATDTVTTINATTVAAGTVTFGGATVAVRPAVKITAANYTIGTTDPNELYGGVIYVTAAATLTVPAVAVGASFTVVTIGAVAVSVDPNASDLIYLDGTALSDGDKVTNLSTAGDIAVFSYYDATGWSASTNGWTDGN